MNRYSLLYIKQTNNKDLPVTEHERSESEVAQLCLTLCDPMDCSLPGFSIHGISQARILVWVAISFSRGSSWPRDWTWVFPHCKWILYQLSHKGSPRTLQWVTYPFSSRSSRSRNWTRVSCVAGRFFTNRAIWDIDPNVRNMAKVFRVNSLVFLYFIIRITDKNWHG